MIGVNSSEWRGVIVQQMQEAGTYRLAFASVIDALAQLLEQRDAVYDLYVADGARPMVERVSDRGAVNSSVNPLLRAWRELSEDALAYWRDLGLTPAGLKRIDEKAMKQKKISAMEKALSGFG